MKARHWVILIVGVLIAAGLGVAAWMFGSDGVETASWLAGVASLFVAIAAAVLALPSLPSSPPQPGSAVNVDGVNSGIISTGNGAQITQHRK